MTDEVVEELANFDLPFGRRANLKRVTFEGGLEMLRMTLREGRRFTIIDLDKPSADQLGQTLFSWASSRSEKSE